MRKIPLTLAAVAMLSWAGAGDLAAQSGTGERIDKVANRRLTGSAYASLRGLSYEQCEQRCLADRQCRALEHVRGGVGRASTSQCRLFRAFGMAHAAPNTDVGYKRPALARDIAPPSAPKPAPGVRSPPPVVSAPTPRAVAPAPRTAAPSPPPTGSEA